MSIVDTEDASSTEQATVLGWMAMHKFQNLGLYGVPVSLAGKSLMSYP